MSELWLIILRNRETFYDYRTLEAQPQRGRIAGFVIISAVLTLIVREDLKDFLAGAITVQAILIGFCFNVAFFLASSKQNEKHKEGVIEDQLAARRIAALSKEIFYNASYFNIVALGCVVAALMLLAPNILLNRNLYANIHAGEKSFLNPRYVFDSIALIMESAVRLIFFISLVESAFTFVRTISRITFFFRSKVEAEGAS